MQTSLTFQNTTFEVVDRNGQPWIRAGQLAEALGYKDDRSIGKIYQRNSDEFSPSMSVVVKLTPTNGVPTETRIFSLRGCHLIAMFARTAIAKAFRVWVLDVLETLNRAEQPTPALDTTSRLSKRTDPERKELTAMINVWVGRAPIHYAAARGLVNAHFGVDSVDKLTVEQVKEAIVYVRERVNEQPKALPEPTPSLTERSTAAAQHDLERHTRAIARILRELHAAVKGEGDRVHFRPLYDPRAHSLYVDALDAMNHHHEVIEHSLDALAYTGRVIAGVVKLHR